MKISLPGIESSERPAPMLIDQYLPAYDVTKVRRTAVDADPETTYEAALAADLMDLGPVVSALGWLRNAPTAVTNRLQGTPLAPPPESLRFADVHETDEWILIEEDPGTEYLFGAVGAFWKPDIEWRRVDPDAFASFDEPGYAKLAISLSVRPIDGERTLLRYEARTATTDERARRNFGIYWRIVGPFAGYLMSRTVARVRDDAEATARRRASTVVRIAPDIGAARTPGPSGRTAAIAGAVLAGLYHFVVRPWHRRWGTTGDEATKRLPGDDLLADATSQVTHAVRIEAPPADVWPWLVQIGQDRGGFYSYDWLERLVGADVHNADRIVPEFQDLAEGDVVRLAPEGYALETSESAPEVANLDPERSLVLAPPGESPAWTWAFVLEPVGPGATRLLSRTRSIPARSTIGPFAGRPRLRSAVEYLFWEPAHFVMDRRMLAGIRQRVERQARLDALPRL